MTPDPVPAGPTIGGVGITIRAFEFSLCLPITGAENLNPVPVVAIDGPSASGKGTVAQGVAARLAFYYLDSGAIYRAAALAVRGAGTGLDKPAELATIVAAMNLRFAEGRILLAGVDVTDRARSEAIGRDASRIAALPAVRAALLLRQRDFRMAPGLVADGRDMASVIFPDAALKVFLTASIEERARRRVRQLAEADARKGLIGKENNANIASLFESAVAAAEGAMYPVVLADLVERDRQDAARSAAPLRQVEGAHVLDTTGMPAGQAVEQVLAWYAAG